MKCQNCEEMVNMYIEPSTKAKSTFYFSLQNGSVTGIVKNKNLISVNRNTSVNSTSRAVEELAEVFRMNMYELHVYTPLSPARWHSHT